MEEIILKTALKTLEIEAATLNSLKVSIDADFRQAVEAIFQSEGRVVVTGIGKSALIAQKIVATFNSTGTPALFMHAADAIHGDLGMIRPEDVVICISKSGDTPEIKVLVPLLKNLGNLLVGMVSNRDSYLGKAAKFILHIPVTQEADPNNLAPTASTTAQMAMGDALAMSLLALKGFSPSDFAMYHPGGALGKRLYLRVSDLYLTNERPVVHLKDELRTAILEMTSRRLGATAVLDEHEQLVGIITDGDLRRMLQRGVSMDGLCAADVMTKNPKTIPAEALAAEALEIMRSYSISQLIVVQDATYLGMVHLHDLIREGLI